MLRRFTPLMVLLGLGLLILLARLWDIQVIQHRVWSTEAANLVRSYGVQPFIRGSLKDRKGRLITRDEEVYALEFVWRDFRRGHPLGQVAMMRSLIMMRPVGLDEARPQLSEAALSYASLTPDEVERFGDGEELDAGIDYVPAIAAATEAERLTRARAERRWPRAGDLRYYIQRLLRMSPREIKIVASRVDEGGGGMSFLELIAGVRKRSVEEEREILRKTVVDADGNLSRLAPLIDWGDDEERNGAQDFGAVVAAGDRLIPLMEERRRAVDDDTADALFSIAAGFSSMRLSEENLARFDLRWLRAALDWDEQRLAEWQRRRGGAFHDAAVSWMAGTTIARAKIGQSSMWGGDRVLSAFAHAFRTGAEAWSREHGGAEDWRKIDELDVVTGLPERLALEGELPEELTGAPVFSFQTQKLRTAGLEGADLVFAAFRQALEREAVTPSVMGIAAGKDARSLGEQLVEVAERSNREWGPSDEALYAAILLSGHQAVQARVGDLLNAARKAQSEDERPYGLAFGAPFVEKALETRRYAIRDRGARPRVVGGEPRTELVLLVTRYAQDFAGFRVSSKTRRVPLVMGPDGDTPIASKLIGAVRSPFLVEVLQNAPDRDELSELQRKYDLPEEDRARILSLLADAHVADKAIGGSGLEAWMDHELSGSVGYREVQGLQDRIEANRAPMYVPKVDGQDVTLTLDIDLQRTAEYVLQNLERPDPGDRQVDDLWFDHPVGAIVLATVEGEILAAASVPVKSGEPLGPPGFTVADGQRGVAIDRTLVRPTGQAPGSVVKPLLAAYALQHCGLSTSDRLEYCDADRPRQGTKPKNSPYAGFGIVNCNSAFGHSRSFGGRRLELRQSLMVSCNVYFAALGERFFDPESMRDAYRVFGFGQPTGVNVDKDRERRGLTDSYAYNPKSPLHGDAPEDRPGKVDRQYLGNGLAHVDVNVVQMARAYAGLATGYLPAMSFVKKVGDQPVPARISSIGIDESHLVFVRAALDSVVNESGGTAFGKGLAEEDLTFRLAAKTGSADYRKGLSPPPRQRGVAFDQYKRLMRKHTWLAGWFPSTEPRFVVVVYCHDTSATASHSAVYVARQFLREPAIAELVADLVEDDE